MDIRKFFTTSKMDSTFDRSFQDRKSQRETEQTNQSDSDSAVEAEKKETFKRKRKRRNRKKYPKDPKPKAKTFKYIKGAPKERVTAANCPEILTVEGEFPKKATPALVEAETNYFNRQNAGEVKAHMKPDLYPFVRALVQVPRVDTFDIHRMNNRDKLRSTLQVLTRSYEESYLREPLGNERPCVNGCECEGLKISTTTPDKRFILVELLMPNEKEEYEKTGKFPQERRYCILCKRNQVAFAWVNIRADAMGMRDDSILQDYRNLVNVPGEYQLKDCILSSPHTWEGLTDPIVLHVRTSFEYEERNGIKYYKQARLSYPTESECNSDSGHFLFRLPSHK